ncbi:hypothetical protein A2U01_0035072, partial [Trifolium medium]|nr:hypothetical protein [Trifolium medium]
LCRGVPAPFVLFLGVLLRLLLLLWWAAAVALSLYAPVPPPLACLMPWFRVFLEVSGFLGA